MAVSPDKLAAVKQYMRVDGDEDDLIIIPLYEAAVLYLKNAGIDEPATDAELYNLAVWGLTLYTYENRSSDLDGRDMPAGLRRIINQLKFMSF